MTNFPIEESVPSTHRERITLVVIDHRVLFRESFIDSLKNISDALTIGGYASVASWQATAQGVPPASIVVIAAAHRSVAQMGADLEALAAISPGVPVVLLSELDDYDQVAEAMQRGLRGFIPVTSSVKVAQSALALVLAGGCFIPSDIVCNRSATHATDGQQPGSIRLTERETAVLSALQIGKPNKIIAYELNMCINTVKVHVRNIMKKLRAKNRTELSYIVNTQGLGARVLRHGGPWKYGGSSLSVDTPLLRLTAEPGAETTRRTS